MLTTRHGVRVLGADDLTEFLALAARDPVVNVFVDYRARTTNLEPRWLGGEMWGRYRDGRLVAACHVGANLVPVQCTDDDAEAFAERALTRGRTISTIVGLQASVAPFWQVGNVKMATDASKTNSSGYKAATLARLPLQLPLIRTALKAARD